MRFSRSATDFVPALARVVPGALLGLHLLARRFGLQNPLRDVADDLLPLVLPGALLFEALLLVRRRWTGALLLAPSALYAAWALTQPARRRQEHSRAVRRAAANSTPAPSLRLLSFNMAHWHGQLTPLLELFHSHEADVVAIQELRHDCVTALAETLGNRYPYQALNPYESAYGGHGILSRYPLRETSLLELTPGAFNHQRAVVELPGGPFVLYSAHPPNHVWQPFDFTRRRRDLTALLDCAAAEALPTVLAGDFNLTEYTDDYQLIRQRFADAYADAGQGSGATWPDLSPWDLPGLPLLRIDYVFSSSPFVAVEAEVLPSAHSDHRPLLVRLRQLNHNDEWQRQC